MLASSPAGTIRKKQLHLPIITLIMKFLTCMKSIKYCRYKKVSEHISVCHDARVKSLKPRCACTGVVLRLSDPPNMVQNIQWMFVLHRPKRSVDIKVERQLHDMRILGRVLCASGTRLAPTEVATEMWEYEVRNNP